MRRRIRCVLGFHRWSRWGGLAVCEHCPKRVEIRDGVMVWPTPPIEPMSEADFARLVGGNDG